MAGRDDPAHRLPPPERDVLPGARRVGHGGSRAGRRAADVRHHPAAGLRDRAPVRLGRDAGRCAPGAPGARDPTLPRRAGVAPLVDPRARPRADGSRRGAAQLGDRQRQLAGLGPGAGPGADDDEHPDTPPGHGPRRSGHAAHRRRLPALHPPGRRLPRRRLGPRAAMGRRAVQGRGRADDRHPGPRDGGPRRARERARSGPGAPPSSTTCAERLSRGPVAAVAPGTGPVRLPRPRGGARHRDARPRPASCRCSPWIWTRRLAPP